MSRDVTSCDRPQSARMFTPRANACSLPLFLSILRAPTSCPQSSDPAADDALKATKLPDAATQASANNGGGIGTYAGMSGSVGPSNSPIHLHCGGVVFDLEE